MAARLSVVEPTFDTVTVDRAGEDIVQLARPSLTNARDA